MRVGGRLANAISGRATGVSIPPCGTSVARKRTLIITIAGEKTGER